MPEVLLILVERTPRLTEFQIKVLTDIGVATGQLTLGAMVLPFIIAGLDRARIPVVVLGSMLTFTVWSLSVLVAKRVKS